MLPLELVAPPSPPPEELEDPGVPVVVVFVLDVVVVSSALHDAIAAVASNVMIPIVVFFIATPRTSWSLDAALVRPRVAHGKKFRVWKPRRVSLHKNKPEYR
jgi:hypothetical protein